MPSDAAARAALWWLLPEITRTMAVLPGADAWADALRAAGVKPHDAPDVAVAPAAAATDAAATGAPTLLLDGRPRALPPGYQALTLTPVPGWQASDLLLDARARGTVRYAMAALRPPTNRLRVARNRALSLPGAAALLQRAPGTVTVASRQGTLPAALAMAPAGAVPDGARWLARLGHPSDPGRRHVLFAFAPGADAPAAVAKLARRRDDELAFEKDVRGLTAAAEAGPVVAARGPRHLGRYAVDGFHASVETALPGTRLLEVLRSHVSRRAKLGAVEAVLSWLVDVARATRRPPEALEEHVEHLRNYSVPPWFGHGAPADAVARLPPVPAVFVHNDLWAGNVLIAGGTVSVVDWESAQAVGPPGGDALLLLTDALAEIDGCRDDDARVRHFVRLFRGEQGPSSDFAFAWVRRVLDASGVALEHAGPLTALYWMYRGYRPWTGERHDAPPAERPFKARITHAWLQSPGLGMDWTALPR